MVTYLREALSLRPPGHRDRSMFLYDLANAVHARYKQLGRMEDLEEAITLHREALSLILLATQIVTCPSATFQLQFIVVMNSQLGSTICKM